MAIKNVNGRNVYVLEPRQPTGKTTSGANWATLYSDLRWQVWEQIQKNEAQMLKMELASAGQRREYYDDKIKMLQDQRKQLQAATLKAQRGSTGSANSDALRAAQGLERMARQTAGKKTVTTKPAKDIAGEIIPGQFEEIVREAIPTGGVDPKARQVYSRIVDEYLAGQATEEDVKAAAAAAGVSPTTGEPAAPAGLDQEIERLDKEIEELLGARQQTGLGVDADLLTRTRRAFEADQGVIGRGGTAFGLAPRPRRTRARVDQPLAEERISQFTFGVAQDKAQREALAARKEQLLNRRQEAMAVGGEMAGALILDVDKQLGEIEAQLSQPTFLEQTLESPEFTPRRAGELLLRDRRAAFVPPTTPQPEYYSEGEVFIGEPTIEGAPAPTVAPEGIENLGLSPMSPEDKQAAEEAVRSAGLPSTKPEGELPPVQTERRPLAPIDRITSAVPVAAPIKPTMPSPTGAPLPLTEEQAIRNPDILDNPDFLPSEDLIKSAKDYFQGMTVQRTGERKRTVRAPIRYFGGEIPMVKEYLKEKIRAAAPVGEDVSEEMEAAEKPQASTRTRKDKYKFQVVAEGTKLAQQPKKLERLTKTAPQHLTIVDRLYETNKGKANAFRLSYDEISRVFANDPDKRKEAHRYLVAKDILEQNIKEPLA